MVEKKLKLIVTFHTSADALCLERAFKKANLPGRLIPAPRVFSTGCGLAWCCEVEHRSFLETIIHEEKIEYEGIFEYEYH